MDDSSLKYLWKSEIERAFKKLKKKETEFLCADYKKCTETTQKLTEHIVSKYNDYITVLKGNLQDLINENKNSYEDYVKDQEKEIELRNKWGNYYSRNIESIEEYINSKIKYNDPDFLRFKRYATTKKEEDKVLYFRLKRDYNSRSKFSFSFCAYYNSEDILYLDKIIFKKERYNWRKHLEFDTIKTTPDEIIWFLKYLLQLNKKRQESYKKRQKKLENDRIKKDKIDILKKKARIINIQKILNKIDVNYKIYEMRDFLRIYISLNEGTTSIKIPIKNINNNLKYIPEFVEIVLKAEKLGIYFEYYTL